MTEIAFLSAVESFLGAAGLPAGPVFIGTAEPAAASDLPAIVLSLDESERLESGLGEGAVVVTGALAAATGLDLASPLLPGDDLSLLSEDRRTLTLFHGGLVRADGSEGPFAAQDLQARLIAPVPGPDPDVVTELVLVPGAPGPGQFQAQPEAGRLLFGEALPATGRISVDYFIGRWSRTVERIRGVLRLDVCAAQLGDAASLSAAAVRALAGPGARAAIDRLIRLTPLSLSSIGPPETVPPNAWRRRASFRFEYERKLDQPASSGGIIGRIPVDTELTALTVDRDTGAIDERVITESG